MATRRNPRTSVAAPYAASQRKPRNPQHRFTLKVQPWSIQPMLIAPVLPGETIANIHMQSQVWSEPLKATLKNTGWWLEYVFYYVKLRDLERPDEEGALEGLRQKIADMLVHGSGDIDTLRAAVASEPYFEAVKSLPWLSWSMRRIVEEYWRYEGESADDFSIGGVPAASYVPPDHRDWTDKLTLLADYEDRRVDVTDASPTGDVTVDAMQRAYETWQALQQTGAMTMDFESWMRTYGSQSTIRDQNDPNLWRPEEIGHIRQWTYPTNSVEPTTGIPAVAVGWRVAERIDKRIFCHEPGFVVGVQCIRPKLYPGVQQGYVAGFMRQQMAWLPAILNHQIDVSHLAFESDDGPLNEAIGDPGGEGGDPPPEWADYVIDLRDLLNYGDYFRNFEPAEGDPFVALPEPDGQRRYASAEDAEALFVDAVGEIDLDKDIKVDGVVSLTIQGRQQEQSPQITLGGQYLTVPSPT